MPPKRKPSSTNVRSSKSSSDKSGGLSRSIDGERPSGLSGSMMSGDASKSEMSPSVMKTQISAPEGGSRGSKSLGSSGRATQSIRESSPLPDAVSSDVSRSKISTIPGSKSTNRTGAGESMGSKSQKSMGDDLGSGLKPSKGTNRTGPYMQSEIYSEQPSAVSGSRKSGMSGDDEAPSLRSGSKGTMSIRSGSQAGGIVAPASQGSGSRKSSTNKSKKSGMSGDDEEGKKSSALSGASGAAGSMGGSMGAGSVGAGSAGGGSLAGGSVKESGASGSQRPSDASAEVTKVSGSQRPSGASGTDFSSANASGSQAGGSQADGSQAGGSILGGSNAGGSQAADGSQASGSQAGGSILGGSKAGGSQASGSQIGGSQVGGSQVGGSQVGGSQVGGSLGGGSQAGSKAGSKAGSQAGSASVGGSAAEGGDSFNEGRPSGESTQRPSGAMSGSQTKPSASMSGSQTRPSGAMSGSESKPSGAMSGSESRPSGAMSGSESKPSGAMSGSEARPSGSMGGSQTRPSGAMSGSEARPSGESEGGSTMRPSGATGASTTRPSGATGGSTSMRPSSMGASGAGSTTRPSGATGAGSTTRPSGETGAGSTMRPSSMGGDGAEQDMPDEFGADGGNSSSSSSSYKGQNINKQSSGNQGPEDKKKGDGGGFGFGNSYVFKDPEPFEAWKQFKNLNCGPRYKRDGQQMFACYPVNEAGDLNAAQDFIDCSQNPVAPGNPCNLGYAETRYIDCEGMCENQMPNGLGPNLRWDPVVIKCRDKAAEKFGVKASTVVSGFDNCGLPNQNGGIYGDCPQSSVRGEACCTSATCSARMGGAGGGGGMSGPTMATKRGQNVNIIPLKNHAMYIQLAGENNMETMKREFYKLSSEYETFAQQQYAFANSLEEARQNEMQSGCKSGTAEIRTMEQVERYVLDKDSQHAVNLRIARQFVCLHEKFEDFYFKMQDYFNRTFTAAVKKQLNTGEAEGLLARLKDFLGKRFNFFDLRVDYPYQQVYRLGVEEARRHFGGAVSYLPIALEIISCARKELARLTKLLEQGIDEDPPIVKSVPKENRPVANFIAKNKKFVDTADLTEKLRILNGKYCSRCALPRRGNKGDCFPFEPERPWKGAGRHGWNYVATRYCACSDYTQSNNAASFCGRSCCK